jgi:hypothetical protein
MEKKEMVSVHDDEGEQMDGAYHAKPSEQTGRPQPNISTIFIGRSRADELE